MMRYTVVKSQIDVVGYIWQPGIGLCAMSYNPRADDLREADILPATEGPITRESVQRWIDTHSGDFSEIVDWRAEIEDGDETIVFEWNNEDNELAFNDAMFGSEE
jgi:hypothetical protein